MRIPVRIRIPVDGDEVRASIIRLVVTWALLASAFGASTCRREPSADPAITADLAGLLDTPGPPVPPGCTLDEAARERLRPTLELIQEAYEARTQWETSVPDPLAERILAADVLTGVDDFVCATNDPSRSLTALTALGAYAALLVDKGAALLDRGDPAAGWNHLLGALRLFSTRSAYGYIFRFSAYWVFHRTAQLATSRPILESSMREALRAAVGGAMMRREELCEGFREEFLVQAIGLFPGHAEPLRRRIEERYRPWAESGDPFPGVVFGDSWAGARYLSREVWTAYRAFYDPLLDGCAAGDLDALAEAAKPRLAALKAANAAVGAMAETTLDRLPSFGKLAGAGRAADEAVFEAPR